MADDASPEVEALERLEKLVQAAGETIQSLRASNADLETANAELEERLKALEKTAGEAADWDQERRDLAQRVGGLADGLQKLIELTED